MQLDHRVAAYSIRLRIGAFYMAKTYAFFVGLPFYKNDLYNYEMFIENYIAVYYGEFLS